MLLQHGDVHRAGQVLPTKHASLTLPSPRHRSPLAPPPRSKANLSHPTKQWGFWRGDKHLGKYEQNADPAIAKLPGRRPAFQQQE